MPKLLQTLEIPLYIREVKLSDSRRAEYYELGKKVKLPKRYSDATRYKWKPHIIRGKTKVVLVDTENKSIVIKNSRSVNTPRYKTINAQCIYNQEITQERRNIMLQQIKAFFSPYVSQLKPIPIEDLPIRIEAELYHPYLASNGQPWDVDNHFWLYQKAFGDVLQGNKDKNRNPRSKVIIPEDFNLCISKPPSPLHIPVNTLEERKIVFFIYKEDDPRILDFPERKNLFNKFLKQS